MGFITPNDYKCLRSLYEAQLRYLLSTEQQIVDGLKSMSKHAQDSALVQAFQQHETQSEHQADRLRTILKDLAGDDDDKKDPICTALIGSGENIVRETSEGPVRDAGLLATAQKIEHYEIASYGASIAWAKVLGLDQHLSLLEQTLEEEKQTDALLTSISQHTNQQAATSEQS